MSIVCSIIGHKASIATVWNRGHHFSTCTRCGVDLVESEDDRWMTPPAGYRIVRKQPKLAPATSAQPAAEPLDLTEPAFEPAEYSEYEFEAAQPVEFGEPPFEAAEPAEFGEPPFEVAEPVEYSGSPLETAEPAEYSEYAFDAAEPAEPPEAPELKSVWEEVRAPEPLSPLQEKRARPDRRVDQNGPLPASLAGVDRRREDRRTSKGNYQPNRRKGLLAQ